MSNFQNLLHLKFNNWKVIGPHKILVSGKEKRTHWLCECVCGTVKYVYSGSLKSGKSFSCGCSKKKYPKGYAARRTVFFEYRNKCKRNNWKFDFSEEEFNCLIINNCFYCGKEPSNIANKSGKMFGSFTYNGIDRVNNNEGYTKENVVTSCKNCNLAKRKLSKEEFFNMIKLIYERHLK